VPRSEIRKETIPGRWPRKVGFRGKKIRIPYNAKTKERRDKQPRSCAGGYFVVEAFQERSDRNRREQMVGSSMKKLKVGLAQERIVAEMASYARDPVSE